LLKKLDANEVSIIEHEEARFQLKTVKNVLNGKASYMFWVVKKKRARKRE